MKRYRPLLLAGVLLVASCGDDLGRYQDAAVDAVTVDAGDLFGFPCPTASVPGHVYACHDSAPDTPDGWCVQPPGTDAPVCRPDCRDTQGTFCSSIGGRVWVQPNGACVCIPA